MATFAIVNLDADILSIHASRKEAEAGRGANQFSVRLLKSHKVGDEIDYDSRGVEVAYGEF